MHSSSTHLLGACLSKKGRSSLPACRVLLNSSLLLGESRQQVRNFRNYRKPKKIHNEIRPDPPPFLGQFQKVEKQMQHLRETPEEERGNLLMGIDFPLIAEPARPRLISCSNQVFNAYKPPKNESNLVSIALTNRSPVSRISSRFELRRIRKSMGDFEEKTFLETANEVYKQLFSELSKVPIRIEGAMQFCTEHCYPILMEGIEGCQVTWQYVETVEPSRIVKATVNSFMQDDHEFAQITVRMHSKQILAIYDRFGRLIKGDPEIVRSVLEYVVFERHMRPFDFGSDWRVHSKIDPNLKNDTLTSHGLDVSFKTAIVPDSFVPQFSTVAPSDPPDPSKWNEKWQDPGYYELTEEEEETIKKEKLRKRRKFDMHPSMRV